MLLVNLLRLVIRSCRVTIRWFRWLRVLPLLVRGVGPLRIRRTAQNNHGEIPLRYLKNLYNTPILLGSAVCVISSPPRHNTVALSTDLTSARTETATPSSKPPSGSLHDTYMVGPPHKQTPSPNTIENTHRSAARNGAHRAH